MTLKDLLEVVMDLVDEIKLELQVKMLRCDCSTFMDICFWFKSFYSNGLLVKIRFNSLVNLYFSVLLVYAYGSLFIRVR